VKIFLNKFSENIIQKAKNCMKKIIEEHFIEHRATLDSVVDLTVSIEKWQMY